MKMRLKWWIDAIMLMKSTAEAMSREKTQKAVLVDFQLHLFGCLQAKPLTIPADEAKDTTKYTNAKECQALERAHINVREHGAIIHHSNYLAFLYWRSSRLTHRLHGNAVRKTHLEVKICESSKYKSSMFPLSAIYWPINQISQSVVVHNGTCTGIHEQYRVVKNYMTSL